MKIGIFSTFMSPIATPAMIRDFGRRADDTGLARKFNVTLTAACTLRDPRTGRILWTDRRISVRREVFTDSGQLQAEYQTLALLTEALAARITSDLVETW